MRGFEAYNSNGGNEDPKKNVEAYSVGSIQESLNAVTAFLAEGQKQEAVAALGRAKEQIGDLPDADKEKMNARFGADIEAYEAEIAASEKEA